MAEPCDLITDLPAELTFIVLHEWLGLTIHILGRLDSAYCNHQSYPILLQLFATKIIVHDSVRGEDGCLLRWLLKREIRVSKLAIRYVSIDFFVFDYLARFGVFLRKLCFTVNYSFCQELITCVALQTILRYTVNLEVLDVFCDLSFSDTDSYEDIALPRLKYLWCPRSCPFPSAFVDKLIHSGHQLQELNVTLDVERTLTLLRSSPQLRAVSLGLVTTDPAIINQLHVLCPNIIALDLSGNFKTKDDHVAILVHHFRLKWLNIQGCFQLTGESFKRIAEHCGSTLKSFHFSFYELDYLIQVDLPAFFAKCRKIHTIVALDAPFFLEQSVFCPVFYHRLFAQWDNVTTLHLEGPVCTDDALAMLAMYCTQLTYLNISDKNHYEVGDAEPSVSVEGLRPVLQGCPLLRKLTKICRPCLR